MIQAPSTISCVAATGSPLCQSHKVLPLLRQRHMVLSIHSTKLHCPLPSPPKPHGPLFSMAVMPGFKSQRQSSSAAPFPTPPTISYTCQHSHVLLDLLGCRSKSGQVWPHGMEPIFSKLSHRCCNQGEFLPVTSWVEVSSIPPGSKHGHSYLTYL